MVFDAGSEHVEPVELRRERGAQSCSRRGALVGDDPHRLGRRVGGDELDTRQSPPEELAALLQRIGERHDAPHVAQRDTRRRDQVLRDREHDLALDEHVHLEHERVEDRAHRALDRVLQPDEPEVDLGPDNGGQHVGVGRHRHQLHRPAGQVGLGQQRLLAERSRRAEEGDPRHAT